MTSNKGKTGAPVGNGADVETVTLRADGRNSAPIEVTFKIGRTLSGLTEQFSEAIVVGKAREKLIINLQDYLRNHAKKGIKGPQLQALADEWEPGVRLPRVSKVDKARKLFAELSAEDRKAFLEAPQPGLSQ